MDFLYSVLKVTSLIATGMFGALGLLTKYKDDQGKITKWGRIALGGILLSSGFSLGLYILETSKAKAAAEKAKAEAEATSQVLKNILSNAQMTADQQKKSLEETNLLKAGLEKTLEQQGLNLKRSDYIAKGMENSLAAQLSVLSGNKRILSGVTNTVNKQGELLSLNTSTLNEVSRGLYPIKDVRVSYDIRVPMTHEQLRNYVSRFNRELTSLLPQLTPHHLPSWFRGGSMLGESNTYEYFEFSAEAPLAPNPETETLAYMALGSVQVELQFFKNPIEPGNHPLISGNWDSGIKPDLTLSVGSSLSRMGDPEEHTINYTPRTKTFELHAFNLPSDPRYWESTGAIVGIPDLLGSQMFVRPRSVNYLRDEAFNQSLREVRRQFELDILFISISDGRELWFRGADLQKHIDKDGYPIYSFVFPKTVEEFRKLER